MAPPQENGQFQIHTDRFLLSDLRKTRWQIKWQIYSTSGKCQFQIHTDRFLLLRAQTNQVADQLPDLLPLKKMAISDSY